MPSNSTPPAPCRRRQLIITVVIVAMLSAWTALPLPQLSARSAVNKFFAAIEAQKYEDAYGIWFNDADWRAASATILPLWL